MGRVVRLIERVSGATGVLAAWLVACLVVAVCYEVFSRYVLGAPTLWAFELGYMLMGTNFLLGAAYTLRERAHIRIDLLYSRFAPRTRAWIDLGAYTVLLLPFTVWLTVGLWGKTRIALASLERSGNSAWNPVIWPYRAIFCLAFLLLSLQILAEIVKCVQALRAPRAAAAG